MNYNNFDQKKISVIEDALKMKDEGKRLSYIVGKFPDYESEIREVFGTAAFIVENKDKMAIPKNILKTLLSKMSDDFSSPIGLERQKKEFVPKENSQIQTKEEVDNGDDLGSLSAISENNPVGKWKIIAPVIILAIVMGILLFKSDSKIENETIIDENIGIPQESDESDYISSVNNEVSSSTEEDKI